VEQPDEHTAEQRGNPQDHGQNTTDIIHINLENRFMISPWLRPEHVLAAHW